MFLLSTEVVEDTPAGIVGCPSDVTTNQESWAVLVIQIKIMKVGIINNYGLSIHMGKEKCKQKGSLLILWNLNPQKTMGKGIYHWKGKDQIDKIHHKMSNTTTKTNNRTDSIWLIIYNCDISMHWPFFFWLLMKWFWKFQIKVVIQPSYTHKLYSLYKQLNYTWWFKFIQHTLKEATEQQNYQ